MSEENQSKICAKKRGQPWTAEEVEYLKTAYENHVLLAEISQKLVRSRCCVKAKASRLGVSVNMHWSQADKDYLKKNYGKINTNEIAKFLNRKTDAVYHMASDLGCRIIPHCWTNEEKEILKKLFAMHTIGEIAKVVGHHERNVRAMARKIAYVPQKYSRKWSREEKCYVRDAYLDNIPLQEIAKRLNRTADSVSGMAHLMGCTLKTHRSWSEEDTELLRKLYKNTSFDDLEKILGRSKASICHRAQSIKVYKKDMFWTDEKRSFVKEKYGQMSIDDLAEKLQCSIQKVYAAANYWGCISLDNRLFNSEYILNPFTGQEEYMASSYESNFLNYCIKNNIYATKKHGIIIPYFDENNEEHSYYPDFLLLTKKCLVELKGFPDKNLLYKVGAAKKYCVENNLAYILIEEDKNFEKYIKLGN